jgi:hypothetical protein
MDVHCCYSTSSLDLARKSRGLCYTFSRSEDDPERPLGAARLSKNRRGMLNSPDGLFVTSLLRHTFPVDPKMDPVLRNAGPKFPPIGNLNRPFQTNHILRRTAKNRHIDP